MLEVRCLYRDGCMNNDARRQDRVIAAGNDRLTGSRRDVRETSETSEIRQRDVWDTSVCGDEREVAAGSHRFTWSGEIKKKKLTADKANNLWYYTVYLLMTLYGEYCVWGIYYVTLRDLFNMNDHMIDNGTLIAREWRKGIRHKLLQRWGNNVIERYITE